MNWYDLHIINERLADVEQYLIEIAAHEQEILSSGFIAALDLPIAGKALEALKTFGKDFATLKQYIPRIDLNLGREFANLEIDGKLSEQVLLMDLRLRMAEARKTTKSFRRLLPIFWSPIKKEVVFGEGQNSINLHKTIINLGRLRSMTNLCSNYLSNQKDIDDEIFKPSNVKSDYIIDLIDSAVMEIEELKSISSAERTRIQIYLNDAKKEALESKPSWSKIVGALIIVAAITSGFADAPNAAQNIGKAIDHILGVSLEKPLQKYLSLPSETEKNKVDIVLQ